VIETVLLGLLVWLLVGLGLGILFGHMARFGGRE
jgi:hypothetical protein